MANDPINKNLSDIESAISNISRAKQDLKVALEKKLGLSIPDSNPLSMYDDYVYAIPSVYDLPVTTATSDSVLFPRVFVGLTQNSIITGEIPTMDPPKSWYDSESEKYYWTDREWTFNPSTGKKEVKETSVEIFPVENRIELIGVRGTFKSDDGLDGDIKIKAGYYGQDQIIDIQRGSDSDISESVEYKYWSQTGHTSPTEDSYKSKYAEVTTTHSNEEGYVFDSIKTNVTNITPVDLINQEPFNNTPQAQPGSTLEGYLGVSKYGEIFEGTMPNNGDVSGVISTLSGSSGSVIINPGYTSGGIITIDSDEKAKIISDNIKKGVIILGVEGSSTIVDVADTTATPAEVLSSVEFYNSEGEKVSGDIAIIPEFLHQFVPGSSTTLNLEPGYYPQGFIQIAVSHPQEEGEDIPFVPSTEEQVISAEDYYFDKFVIAPAQEVYSGSTFTIAKPNQVLEETYYLSEDGIEEGTMENLGFSENPHVEEDEDNFRLILKKVQSNMSDDYQQIQSKIADKDTSYFLPRGFYNNNSIAIKSEDGWILPENIRYDSKILNVDGTFTDSSTATGENGAINYFTEDDFIYSDEVLIGYSAWVDGKEVIGKMPYYGPTEEETETYYITDVSVPYVNIPLGYHNGKEKVSLTETDLTNIISKNIKSGTTILGVQGDPNVVDTSDFSSGINPNPKASANEILLGYSAYVDGQRLDGMMPNNTENTIIISQVKDQYRNVDSVLIPEGYYYNSYAKIADSEIQKLRNTENIRSGETILGVTGTFTNDANIGYYEENGEYLSNDIIAGYSAYKDGKLIWGNIPTIETPGASVLNPNIPYNLPEGDPGYYPNGVKIQNGTVNVPEITYSYMPESYDPRSVYKGAAYKIITPKVEYRQGYISNGRKYGNNYFVYASELIDQDALKTTVNGYEQSLLALPSEVAKGKRYVNGQGQIINGQMESYSGDIQISNSEVDFSDDVNVVFCTPDPGYYARYTGLCADYQTFVDSFNDYAEYSSKSKLEAINIRDGVTLFGVTGSFGSQEKEIELSSLNFGIDQSILFNPNENNAFKSFTINNDIMTSDKIPYGLTLFGITGTYEGTLSVKLTGDNIKSSDYDIFNGFISNSSDNESYNIINLRDYTDYTVRLPISSTSGVTVSINYVDPENHTYYQQIYEVREPGGEPELKATRTLSPDSTTKDNPLEYTIDSIDSNTIIKCEILPGITADKTIHKITVYRYTAIADTSLTTLVGDSDPDNENIYKFFNNEGELTALKDNFNIPFKEITKSNPEVEIDKGYYSHEFTVGLSNENQEKLIAKNIRSGIELMGVTGEYNGQVDIYDDTNLPASTRLTVTYYDGDTQILPSNSKIDCGDLLTIKLNKTIGSCPYRTWIVISDENESTENPLFRASIPAGDGVLEYTFIAPISVSIVVKSFSLGNTLYFNILPFKRPKLGSVVITKNGTYYPETYPNESKPLDGYNRVDVNFPFYQTTATPNSVMAGETFFDATGNLVTGAMAPVVGDIYLYPGHDREQLNGVYDCYVETLAGPYIDPTSGEVGHVIPDATETKTYYADDSHFIDSFTVGPATDIYLEASQYGANIATPDQVVEGNYYLSENGIEEGTMRDLGSIDATISTKSGSVTIPEGYTSGGTVSLENNAIANLVQSNIKKDVTILGVTGTLEGSSATLISKNISSNGTYNASSDGADGYSSVTVNIPSGFNLNLNGTTWLFKNNYQEMNGPWDETTYNISFECDDINYNSIKINDWRIDYDNEMVFAPPPPQWYNNKYRTITITSNTDITDIDFIYWLLKNATKQ